MGLVAAVGTAVTAVAASAGIAVTAAAVTVGFETIAAVGAVLGVVGKITGSKALSFAGLAIGAIGGIGALASGAGLLGADALGQAPATAAGADAAAAGTIDSVAGTGVAAGEGFAPEAAAAASDAGAVGAGGAAGGAGVVDQGAFDVPGAASGAAQTAAVGGDQSSLFLGATKSVASAVAPDGSAQTTPPSGMPDTVGLNTTTTPGAASATATPSVPGPTPGEAALPTPPQAPGNVGATDEAGNLITHGTAIDPKTGQLVDVSPGGGGFFGNILDFAKNNPVVALGALQAGGSLLAGATSTLTPAQVAALNAQANSNDAAAALVKQQTANLNMPKATASSAPITGAPQQLVPSPTAPAPTQTAPAPAGFINQAPPVQQPRVTGVAA